jgi:hypothetical protein
VLDDEEAKLDQLQHDDQHAATGTVKQTVNERLFLQVRTGFNHKDSKAQK